MSGVARNLVSPKTNLIEDGGEQRLAAHRPEIVDVHADHHVIRQPDLVPP